MLSLLLVDDHPVVHVALEAALMKSSRPYRLQAAQDDVQALALLAEAAYGLVILDIGLPQVDGLQLLKKIRRRYPQQKILIYTAQEADVYARMAHAAGADGFVNKGSSLAELVRRSNRCWTVKSASPPLRWPKRHRRRTAGCSPLRSSRCWAC